MKFIASAIAVLLGLQSLYADEAVKLKTPELVTGQLWMRSSCVSEKGFGGLWLVSCGGWSGRRIRAGGRQRV